VVLVVQEAAPEEAQEVQERELQTRKPILW
jgi:hypothetical protein